MMITFTHYEHFHYLRGTCTFGPNHSEVKQKQEKQTVLLDNSTGKLDHSHPRIRNSIFNKL